MINRIHDYMIHNKMIEEGGCILAAVSGGADSMCLLEILRELQAKAGFQLRVLHVHHRLRESAEGDLEYVAGYCAASGIPFEAVRVDAAGYAVEAGMSVEEAARHLRYEALESAAERWDCENKPKSDSESSQQTEDIHCRIAVAHHLEDQAETVLFNLVRGSRLRGLRGMLPVNGRIIRPLLECSRREIEDYLRERGITWREDETNEDIRYARNLLRREVMPLLEKINAGAVQHIAKAAEEAAETEEFLIAETEKVIKGCRERQEIQQKSIVLSISRLLQEPPLIRRRVVYEAIAEAAGRKKDLRDVHVQDVLKLAQKNGNGRLVVFGGVQVEKVYDRLIFSATVEPAPPFDRRWPLDASEYSCRVFDFDGNLAAVSRKQYTKWFDYDKIGTFPSFRTRREGDRITIDESGRSKSIARYMIDAKIPAELRGRIVLPAAGKEILWVPAGLDANARQMSAPAYVPNGLNGEAETIRSSDSGRISASYMVSGRTRRILEIRWKPESRINPGKTGENCRNKDDTGT
ncbi:MAG: tRNA lysidine(34) synthetase TilS [Lachnospiraceae bacterium]|nr:tRNA lysidine(34) synthetase TilS [Lachnospiraceae bacterium]